MPTAITVANRPTPSSCRVRLRGTAIRALHSTRTGPTTRAPTASPSHHVNQIAGYSRQLAFPPSVRLLAPIVALTVVLKSPPSTTNLKTSRERLKTSRPFAKILTRSAPSRPSKVLPSAMPIEVTIDPVVVTFTRKAPAKTAGHTRGPSSRNEANAIPVGGQTGETLSLTTARLRPSLPARK